MAVAIADVYYIVMAMLHDHYAMAVAMLRLVRVRSDPLAVAVAIVAIHRPRHRSHGRAAPS